jgi:hypothetical protein
LPPLILPPWLVEKDRYNIRLPHIDTLVAIADKGRRPPRSSCPIGPAPSGLYKTAQDTITRDVPKLAVPATRYALCFRLSLSFPRAVSWPWPYFPLLTEVLVVVPLVLCDFL